MDMRKILLYLMCVCAVFAANAQVDKGNDPLNENDKTKVIYAEAFGASTLVGVNFDSRFKGNKGWGYRAGISYAYGNSDFVVKGDIRGAAIPLEINYLFGSRKSKFELGTGVSLGYYKEKYEYINLVSYDDGYRTEIEQRTYKSFGYFVFFTIGYRYQPIKGFDFRVGITPSFNFGDKRGLSRYGSSPYLSFGYAF